ncbi:hypothetical protein [Steroidobacter cummioxidans]|uniref:hypothetical protein n=1 Tax=Steroidobacter cummioxidans TaxID=1803913 RepID=UPI000E31A51A|nr:hypothetical protein [Steroidobacter cummioxidans]
MSHILVINSSVSGEASISRILVEDAVQRLSEVNPDAVLAFIGITDVAFIHAEGIGHGPEARELALANARSRIAEAAISAAAALRA